MERTPTRLINPETRTTTAVLGVMLAIAGFHHGVLEIIQGNQSTGSLFFMAVVPGQLMWPEGTEGAFTLIPNFLMTGVVACIVALAAAAFAWVYLERPYAPLIFLLLFVLLTLVGGGIGHIAFFIPVWAYATRIDKPLTGWRKIIPVGARATLARLWRPLARADGDRLRDRAGDFDLRDRRRPWRRADRAVDLLVVPRRRVAHDPRDLCRRCGRRYRRAGGPGRQPHT